MQNNMQEPLDQTPNDTSNSSPSQLKKIYGFVKCDLLNVRKKASIGSDIVDVLKRGNKVAIDKSKSTDAFYKVYRDGIEGFCMKEYIEVSKGGTSK